MIRNTLALSLTVFAIGCSQGGGGGKANGPGGGGNGPAGPGGVRPAAMMDTPWCSNNGNEQYRLFLGSDGQARYELFDLVDGARGQMTFSMDGSWGVQEPDLLVVNWAQPGAQPLNVKFRTVAGEESDTGAAQLVLGDAAGNTKFDPCN